jgi:hypothetical protein
MAAERRTKLLKEASDELIAEAKDELAALREKARGRRLRKEEIDPIITDLRRLTGWSEATVVDRLNLSKKKYYPFPRAFARWPKCRSELAAAKAPQHISRRRSAMASLLIVASIFASEIVHALGRGERARVAGAISTGIEPLGTRQGRRKGRLRPLLGAFDRAGGRLAIELCADRLGRHRSRAWVLCGLVHRLLKLRDSCRARTGMRGYGAEARGDNDKAALGFMTVISRLVVEGKDTLPVILHADYCPAFLLRLVV